MTPLPHLRQKQNNQSHGAHQYKGDQQRGKRGVEGNVQRFLLGCIRMGRQYFRLYAPVRSSWTDIRHIHIRDYAAVVVVILLLHG